MIRIFLFDGTPISGNGFRRCSRSDTCTLPRGQLCYACLVAYGSELVVKKSDPAAFLKREYHSDICVEYKNFLLDADKLTAVTSPMRNISRKDTMEEGRDCDFSIPVRLEISHFTCNLLRRKDDWYFGIQLVNDFRTGIAHCLFTIRHDVQNTFSKICVYFQDSDIEFRRYPLNKKGYRLSVLMMQGFIHMRVPPLLFYNVIP